MTSETAYLDLYACQPHMVTEPIMALPSHNWLVLKHAIRDIGDVANIMDIACNVNMNKRSNF